MIPVTCDARERSISGDALAFARARDGEGGERLREQPGRRLGEPGRVALGVTHDARPAQQIDGIDAPFGAEAPADGTGTLDQRIQQVGVERELAAGRGARPDIKRRIDLAAPRRDADGAAELGFQGAKLLGDAQADLEVAVVDAADLPGEQARGRRALRAREAGHALQHRWTFPGVQCRPLM